MVGVVGLLLLLILMLSVLRMLGWADVCMYIWMLDGAVVADVDVYGDVYGGC